MKKSRNILNKSRKKRKNLEFFFKKSGKILIFFWKNIEKNLKNQEKIKKSLGKTKQNFESCLKWFMLDIIVGLRWGWVSSEARWCE